MPKEHGKLHIPLALTYSTSECRTQVSVAPHQHNALPIINALMSQPIDILSTDPEGRISFAIQAIKSGQFSSIRAAAKASNVCLKRLERRLKGIPIRRDCIPKTRKLTSLEESVVVKHILDLDSRGFPPRLRAVKDIANQLLADRDGGTVGINWASNFIKRRIELKTRFNRKYDYKRA